MGDQFSEASMTEYVALAGSTAKAIRFDGTPEGVYRIIKQTSAYLVHVELDGQQLSVSTNNGEMFARKGDWILDTAGGYYVLNDEAMRSFWQVDQNR